MCTKFKQGIDDNNETEQNPLQVELAIWNGFKPLVFLGQFLGVFYRNTSKSKELKTSTT